MQPELVAIVLLAIVLVYHYTKDKKMPCITEDGDLERLGVSLLAGAAAGYAYLKWSDSTVQGL